MLSSSNFLKQLVDIECIKFGNFTLKSGIQSPIYIDLRNIVSYPNLLSELAELFAKEITKNTDIICGVPYAAMPIATAVSLLTNLPSIIKRKEVKGYGTKKLIEGKYKAGDKILLIEDVITSGESLIETIAELENEGLIIEQILVVLDREQGGLQRLRDKGYNVSSLFSISSIMKILLDEKKIEKTIYDDVISFVSNNNIHFNTAQSLRNQLPKLHPNPIAQKLLDIAHQKRSNIIASIDVTKSCEVLEFVEKIGNKVCAVKLHIDIIEDFSKSFVEQLKNISHKKNFLLIEDRKFADIGNTQVLQLHHGIYSISSWADVVTIHLIAGEPSLKALHDSIDKEKIAFIPVIEMSSQGSLTNSKYIDNCKKIMNTYSSVIGAVCQTTNLENNFLKFTPGINIAASTDNKGQQYNSPAYAITQLQSHFLIVGRGLYQAENVEMEIEKYIGEVNNINFWD